MIRRIILSILLGCIAAVMAFFILLVFSIASGLFGWSDGGDPEYLRRLQLTTMISLYASIFFGSLIGGYITHLLSKKKYAHSITTVILFISLIFLSGRDFKDLFPYLSVTTGCLIGGILPVSKKKNVL